MAAVLVQSDFYQLGEAEIADLIVWEVPVPVIGSEHRYKYRLAYIVEDVCVLRFDNERGKGDHFHLGGKQFGYVFKDVDRLNEDFWTEVWKWRQRNKRH